MFTNFMKAVRSFKEHRIETGFPEHGEPRIFVVPENTDEARDFFIYEDHILGRNESGEVEVAPREMWEVEFKDKYEKILPTKGKVRVFRYLYNTNKEGVIKYVQSKLDEAKKKGLVTKLDNENQTWFSSIPQNVVIVYNNHQREDRW